MSWNQEWVDAARQRYGGNVKDVKTKEILENAMSGTALHGDGDRVYGCARDHGNTNRNQIWMILEHTNGSKVLVNEANGGIIYATGHNSPVTLANASIDDSRVQWEASYSTSGIAYRNREYTDCYLNLAAGGTADGTQVYCYISHDKGSFWGGEGKWHVNASWRETHLNPGEI